MRKLTFEDYQAKLAHQQKFLQLLLYSPRKKKYYLYKPKMASIYGDLEQKTNYFKKLRQKLNIRNTNIDGKISFITLTYDTKLYSAVDVLNRCKHDLQKWFKLIRHRRGDINYFWIVELTKRNYVHFHLIVKEYIPSKIINACWRQVTGSIITNVKGVTSSQASRYITKYVSEVTKLSESQAKFLYDNEFKRLYASSRGFFTKSAKLKGNFILIGIITNPLCVVIADTGKFAELEQIALKYIIALMKENTWGYILKAK